MESCFKSIEDKRESAIYEATLPYDFHLALEMDQPKYMRDCFETFITPKIVNCSCKWTNERTQIYLEANDIWRKKFAAYIGEM